MANDSIGAARRYHELTKHSYTSVRSGAYALDWDNKPLPYKIYPEAAAIALPRDLQLSPRPALRAIGEDAPAHSTSPIELETLTRLLFCADGLTRSRRVGGEDYHFRAAPSAGALYPIEVYLAASEVEGLEAGLYHFSPADLKLRGLRRGDFRAAIASAAGMRQSAVSARAILIASAIFWRSAWKYRARAYRYCFWDAGTMLANLLAAAAADAIPAEIVTAFEDPPIEMLLGIDGEHEGALAIVPLGSGARAMRAAPDITPLKFESIALSRDEVVYDELVKMHQESRLVSGAEVKAIADAPLEPLEGRASSDAVRFDTVGLEDALGVGQTILRRGSTRVFVEESIAGEELQTIVEKSSGHPRADFPSLTDTYLIVNAVDGMDAGAYFYDRDSRGFELLKRGNFRGEAGYLCLEQALGMNCSVLMVYMGGLERAMRPLGNRGYRDAHLEAGLHGGRAYIAAYALDRGASGLTFYDDDTTRFFEPHASGKSPLLMVAIGVPPTRVKEAA